MLRQPSEARGKFIESLETRRLLAVSMTADGWTNITPSSTSRLIYVSSSTGSDSNPGTQAKPIKSLAKAKTLVRDKSADQVLLKRGDTWNESFGDWTVSGKSAQEMILIGAYGTGARPKIYSGNNMGITLAQKYSLPLNNVAIIGLEFFANTFNGSNGSFKTSGIRVMRGGSNVIIEDNYIRGYKDNITLDTDYAFNGLKVRRNVIADSYKVGSTGGSHSQGLYGGPNLRNTLIEENIFDHNGHKAGVRGAGATMFNHSVYMQTGSTGTIVRNNIIARSSMRAILLRGGGVAEGNLLVRNPVGIQAGNGSTTANNNVILEGNDLPVQQLGKGIEVFSMNTFNARNNIIAHDISTGIYNNIAFNIQGGVGTGSIANNIVYNWENGIAGDKSGFTFPGNQINTSKMLTRSRPAYVSPNRLLGTYNASLGKTGTLDAFLAEARKQSRQTWNPKYTASAVNAYIRAGFTLTSNRPAPAPPPTTTTTLTNTATSVWSAQRIDPAAV